MGEGLDQQLHRRSVGPLRQPHRDHVGRHYQHVAALEAGPDKAEVAGLVAVGLEGVEEQW